jgi:Zn-dependent peptidase ImmA (M78 family)
MALQRQIFTLFHELYHLLSGHNGVDFTDDKQVLPNLTKDMQRLERACDSFAAEFLVPTDDFQYEISQIPSHHEVLLHGSYSDVMDDCVNPLSKKYSVSLDVILRKLLDAGCIDSSRYSQLYRNHRPDISRDPGNNGGGNYYSNQVSYLGRPYIHLVMETQEMHGFPDYVTAEYLGESVKNLPQLVKTARGSL